MEAVLMKKISEIEVELEKIAEMEEILLKWKRDWWKNIAEMEVGLMKKYGWNWSGINEKYCWMEAVLEKNIAEWERDFLEN